MQRWLDWYNSKMFQYFLILFEGRPAPQYNDLYIQVRGQVICLLWMINHFAN